MILMRQFLLQPICHLKIRPAKIEDSSKTIVRVELIVQPEESFAGASVVVKIIDRRRIEIALRG